MSQSSADELVARAETAERAAERQNAAALWDELIAAHPRHPRALFLQGRHKFDQGDPASALVLLAQSEAGDRDFPETPFLMAACHRALSEPVQALTAIERALAIDPYFFLALLTKAAILDSLRKPRLAARIYRNAIKIAPAEHRLGPSARAALQRGRECVAANAQALAEHLRSATSSLREAHTGERLERFDECLDIFAGVKTRYVQEPLLLNFPRLPPIPFYDRDLFDWLPQLEQATSAIQEELAAVLREGREGLIPYIQLPRGAPVNQWAELNYSPKWSSYYFWRDGEKHEANCARCPNTTALLENLPLADHPGYAPTAMFSVLSPKTHIPAHTGSSNTRLIAHLPLLAPPECRFRVGNDVKEWRMGEAWVYDDTIEHEIWNASEETHVILMFDIWNPLMSVAERELVTEMLSAMQAYLAAEY